MAESRVTSIAAEVLTTPVSEARITSVAAEVLATASSEARVSAIALEALVSVAQTPGVPTSSHAAAIVMILGT
jgi:type III secretory pathway component EscV